MKFIKGETYYYIGNIGIIEFIFDFYDKTSNLWNFNSKTASYGLDENQILMMNINKDLAQIIYNKKQFILLQNDLEFHKRKLDKYNNELEILNKSQERLKEQYPEEFI